jgi:hypothetical protein
MEDLQDYRFTIIFDKQNRLYSVTGFVRVGTKWSQDGATLHFGYMYQVADFIQNEKHTTRNVLGI